MIQTPLHCHPFYTIFSTKRQKYLTDRDTWTGQVRLCNYFPQGSWRSQGEFEYIQKYFSDKFPEENIEVRLFQLQYVKIN
jgi:hypothetical protein